MIADAAELRDKLGSSNIFGSSSGGTIVPGDQGTLVSQAGSGQVSIIQHLFLLHLTAAGNLREPRHRPGGQQRHDGELQHGGGDDAAAQHGRARQQNLERG